jgi:hypothetical protein
MNVAESRFVRNFGLYDKGLFYRVTSAGLQDQCHERVGYPSKVTSVTKVTSSRERR